MRLWSLHPCYLDARGLVALWREGLLAQKALEGATRGYRNHPQLERFRDHPFPDHAIAEYLHSVCDEAARRRYRFDRGKITHSPGAASPIEVSDGQMRYELGHLADKLERRAPAFFQRITRVSVPDPHPFFVIVPGPISSWERL